jgi:O-antigen/teichoic acid export membrane protein
MSNNKKTLTNLLWRFAERCGSQGVTFIVSIVLARLLEPEVFGTIAIVTAITNILQVFVDSGLGNALIQKKDADDLDFSSVFYFNFVVCIVLYAAMFFAAPFIASFYENAELTPIIRVISLTLVISGVKNIQQAYVSRNLMFKRFFYSTLGGVIVSAIVGIVMAYMGFGVWAIVFQQLSNAAIGTAILWLTVKWRPKFLFSKERLKGLLSYGWKLLVSALLNTGYLELRNLLIGKFYKEEKLAYYSQGDKFPKLIVTNINVSIDSVLLPTMSAEQDDRERVKSMTRRSIKTSVYIMAPLMMGLVAVAEPLVSLVLTDDWLPCVFFLRIFCITYMFYPIHTANLNAIKAMGRSDVFLKLEVIKMVIGMVLLVSTVSFGVEAIALSLLVSCVTSQIVNSWPNKKLLNYSYPSQLKDILPSILAAVIMCGVVYCVTFIGLNDILTLIIQVAVGAVIYIALSKLFKIDSFDYLLTVAKSFVKKTK